MISAEEIESSFELHRNIIERYIGDRKDLILNMIDDLGEQYIMSPASPRHSLHNCFPGGYIEHVNRVVLYAMEQSKLFEKMDGRLNFTIEELVFSALFHDLGKIGVKGKPTYIPQTDKWRKQNLGEDYTINGELDFMTIPDRSIFILQSYGIPISQNEFIGIRVHDGVFDEANNSYFKSYRPESRFKSNLPYILHVADYLASKVEEGKIEYKK